MHFHLHSQKPPNFAKNGKLTGRGTRRAQTLTISLPGKGWLAPATDLANSFLANSERFLFSEFFLANSF